MANYSTIPDVGDDSHHHVVHRHGEGPDKITEFGGGIFRPLDILLNKFGKILAEATDDECTLLLCGCFCQPCLLAQALEEADEGNWWFHCCTATVAPQFLGIPYLCLTIPSMNELNVRLGGETMWIRNFLCLMFCRPCVACQLARAVREAKIEGRLRTGAPQAVDVSRN